MAVINSIADREQEMKTWRHLLHQHPETSYEEVWTSDFIAEKLQSFGVEIHRGMGKTGIVGVLHGSGQRTAAIGLRAVMDALPMQEKNEFAHASNRPGECMLVVMMGIAPCFLGQRNISLKPEILMAPYILFSNLLRREVMAARQ